MYKMQWWGWEAKGLGELLLQVQDTSELTTYSGKVLATGSYIVKLTIENKSLVCDTDISGFDEKFIIVCMGA